MSTGQQALQSLGVQSTSRAATTATDDLEQTSEQSKILEGPIEVRPGVFYDPTTAEAMGYEPTPTEGVFDTIKKAFTGQLESPPPEAFITEDLPTLGFGLDKFIPPAFDQDVTQEVTTEQMQAIRTDQFRRMNEQRYARLKPLADEFGVDIIPGYESNIVSNLIAEKSSALSIDGQQLLYLADTPEQFENALGQMFGPENVRMITDDGISPEGLFAPKHYVSIQTEDGWTDFAPTTVGVSDFISRFAPGIGAETAAYLPIIPLAMKVGATVAAASGPAAIVTAPVAVGYTLFVGAKGVEKGRQFLQDNYGLNGVQADAVKNYFTTITDAMKEVVFPEWVQDAADDVFILESMLTPSDNVPGSTPDEKSQQLSGYIESVLGTVPGLRAMIRQAKSKLFESGAVDVIKKYKESGVNTQAIAVRTQGKGTLGIDDPLYLDSSSSLKSLILPQISKSKILDRLTSLVSQNTVRIDEALREQIQSVVRYIKTAGDTVGKGDVTAFRTNVENIGATLQSYKNGAPPEVAATDRSLLTIGESLNSLDEMFLAMRHMVSQRQYGDVFTKLKKAKYDLSGIRERLSSDLRTIIPTTDPASKPKTKTEPDMMSPVRGEMQFDNLIDEIMRLGTTQTDGSRLLNEDQVKKAVERFQIEHPEFNFSPEDITSPAELLHMYAKRFGDLAVNTFGTGAPAQNPGRYSQAIGMKNALLDLIGSPVGLDKNEAAAIKKQLDDANAYSRKTFELTSTDIQNQARIARRGPDTPESGQIARELAYPSQEVTQTALNIAEQSKQIKEFLEVPQNVRDLTEYLTKKNSAIDLDKTAPKAIKAFDDIQTYVRNRIDDALNATATADKSVQKPVTALDDVLNEFKDPLLRDALGLTDDVVIELRNDASLLAQFRESPVVQAVRDLAPNSSFNDVFSQVDWSSRAEIRKGLNDLSMTARRAPTKEAREAAQQNLREGLFSYLLSPESGFLKTTTKAGTILDYGDIEPDGAKLTQLIEDLRASGGDKILTDVDFAMLEGIAQYSSIVKAQIVDAGSALSGAQIIGNLFTLDPSKFAAGIARLTSQDRIARLLVSQDMVDMALGMGRPMSQAEKIKNLFFGKTSLGSIIINEAMQDGETNVEQQTDAILNPGGEAALKSLGF